MSTTSPSSSPDLRERIAERVVRVSGLAYAAVGVSALVLLRVIYPDEPRRLYPAAMGMVLLAFTAWLARRGRWRTAAASMVVSLSGIVLTGMVIGGGPLALAYWAIIPGTAMVGWLYGARAGALFVLTALAAGAVTGALLQRGLIPPPPPRVIGHALIAFAAVSLLTIVATVLPFAMAREALDESERARAALLEEQAQKREAQAAFAAIFDQTAELMGLLDPEGRLLHANTAALTLVGKAEGEVLGQPFWETPWWSEGDRGVVRDAIARAAQGERVRFQTSHRDAQGKKHVIDFSLGPYRDAQGEVLYLIPEGRDITDLVETQARLTQAQKMDAIGQLAGGIAHDFNNLLTGIVGSAELLALELRDAPPESLRRNLVDTILKAGDRATDLTAQLLSFGRKGTPYREPLHLHESVRSVTNLLARTIDPSVRIALDLAPGEPTIRGDATTIENALLNLALNARDAMKDGGVLTFRTQVVELDDAFCRSSGFDLRPGRAVQVSVEDTGPGIAPEHRPHIFEPFFTTKSAGTGLGLAAVFGAVVSHQGAVLVESEPGAGARFHLYFPTTDDDPAAPVLEAGEAEGFDGFRVLLADDDPIVRATAEAHLAGMGFEVRSVDDGLAALARFREDPNAYELLVLDVIMPGMRGPAVAREALALRPELPVVLMSGFPREEDLSILGRCRGRFLRKPFTRVDLLSALSVLLDSPVPDDAVGAEEEG